MKTLEKPYMKAQLAKAGSPGPTHIGIDEISFKWPSLPHRGQRP